MRFVIVEKYTTCPPYYTTPNFNRYGNRIHAGFGEFFGRFNFKNPGIYTKNLDKKKSSDRLLSSGTVF